MDHEKFMDRAVKEARAGAEEGGIPIGSVLVHEGVIIGRGHNRRMQSGSVIRHAEMDCLERAGRKPANVYRNSVLYSTLSPCSMCTGAVLLYGIPTVVIGENRSFQGPERYAREQGVDLVVLDREDCRELMESFIRDHPEVWNEDIGE